MTTVSTGGAARVLHCFSRFSEKGGSDNSAWRATRLMNAFGKALSHTIVSAEPDQLDASHLVKSGVSASYPRDFPALKGWSTPGRLVALAKVMRDYDLILTYGWGAMSAVMAHTTLGQAMGLPPLIHHEGGFDSAETRKLKASRNWYRRIALGRAAGLVVPSERLEGIALATWYQPIGRVKTIADGIETRAFARKCRPDALRGTIKREDEKWLGAYASDTNGAQLGDLVRAMTRLPDAWQLVILGDVANKDQVRAIAAEMEISHRLHMPGTPRDPANVMGLFDMFAHVALDTQFPLAAVQAMAAGAPMVGYDVGDLSEILTRENAAFLAKLNDAVALGDAIEQMHGTVGHGQPIGSRNQEHARAVFDEKPMIESYRRLYASALGREL